MRLRPLLSLMLLGLAVSACATGPEESAPGGVPDWVLETPEDLRYAYGVGSSPVRDDQAHARRIATDRARSDLIQGLRVTVSGGTVSWIERVREDGAGPVTRGFAEQVRTRVPDTTLDEMEMAEAVVDEASEVLYVLVRLDRSAATLRLSNQLNRVRDRLEELAGQVPNGGDRLALVRHYLPALEQFAQAEQLEEQLSLIARQAAMRDPVSQSHAHVLDQARDALDALRIQVDDEAFDSRIAHALKSGLLEQGLRVGGDQTPDLVIGGDIRIRTVSRDPDYFAFAEGDVVVRDAEGRALGQFRHRSREGSTDAGLAEDRVLSRMGDALGRDLGRHLIEFL
ncbi:hypothetical protein J2T60_001963 [Natronospira proteinivora]|uniref:LPP20 lipoprotein n=1 Tax=Natronospira proteinivora TaxID=1807133 RepID=A0ABT1G9G7_9GAMM|nr:LPP20 family lipoprotein [Natronospira proteinivora]MCP1727963.1 hypothetical protein [Natronospira proteinivora]